jgi:hypothetical protein
VGALRAPQRAARSHRILRLRPRFYGVYEEDLAEFVYDVRELDELRAKAVVARKAVAEKEQKLRVRIETLRGVVSK